MKLHHYNEFENYLNSIRDAEFTSLIQQIEIPIWSICHIDLDDIHIQYGKENSGHIASGNIRADGWTFFLMLAGEPARADGQELVEGAAFIIPPGQSFHISTNNSHEWLSIFIPSRLLLLDKKKKKNQCATTDQKKHITFLDPSNLKQFLKRLRAYQSNDNSIAITHKVETQLLKDLIIKLANNLIHGSETTKVSIGRKVLNRNKIITEALCIIHNKKAIGINIKKLKEATGVSERTLRTAFYEFFGISPLNYIISVRLHEAKQMIQDPKYSNKLISFFSSSVGFSDPGRFANRYHSLFGELPNQTLLRTKKDNN